MPALSNTQSVALQLEKVRPKIPVLFERDDILLALIKAKADVEKTSSRNMRVPLQIRPGGKASQHTMDGDDLGLGSGTTYDVGQLSPVFETFGVQINKLVEYATTGNERALENAAKREVANGMNQFRWYLDTLLQTNGNGVLGSISSFAGTTWTLTNPQGAALFYYNQDVQVYDSTLTTNRGVATITSVDPLLKQITVNANPAGLSNGDVIVPNGLTGAQPVSIYGVKYHHVDSATGTWLGLPRATYPEVLKTPHFAAGSASLVPAQIRLVINKLRKVLGTDVLSKEKLIAYLSPEQEHAWEQLGITVSEIVRGGAGVKDGEAMPDLLYNQMADKRMAGVPIKTSIHADTTRIDFIALARWGRAVMKEIDYYEIGGQTVFPVYGASGGLAAAYLFYFIMGFQIWMDGPRFGAFVDGLALPSGY
jgi:hypothetical protein